MEDVASTVINNEEDNAGKPLQISLKRIDVDPNQPRKEINQATLNELADSIKLRNVKQPISIRRNPNSRGSYIINAGERRYRASIIAGKNSIPAFIDETFEDYDQVIENEQRENLSAMELALFIHSKSKAGTPKIVIAKSLSRSQNVITSHLAMIEMPDVIADAYRTGRIKTAKTIHELRKVYNLNPTLVSHWIADIDFITRAKVQDLRERVLKSNEDLGSIESRDKQTKNPRSKNVIDIKRPASPKKISTRPMKTKTVSVNKIELENKEGICNPLMLVKYDDKRASVLLHKFPTVQGRIWIRFESGSEMEVGASALQIISLSDR